MSTGRKGEGLSTARSARYGLLAPVENADVVHEQLLLATHYYNDLVALERFRRKLFRELRATRSDLREAEERAQALAEELEHLRARIRSARSVARTLVKTPEIDARAKEIRRELAIANGARKAARAAALKDAEFVNASESINQRAKVWAKAMRVTSGVYWGTYLLTEASLEDARRAGGLDPRYRRHSQRERISNGGPSPVGGRIGVQIQYGISVERLTSGEDWRVRLTDAAPLLRGKRYSARGLRRCATKILHIRVGTKGRTPIWAVFPLIMHRPLPPDALIKSVAVKLQMIGFTQRWSVTLNYTQEQRPPLRVQGGVVAFTLGWRKRQDGGLRVAYWCDDHRRHGEIVLPAQIEGKLQQVSDLRSLQDRLFNRARRWLQLWLRVRDVGVPDYLADARSRLINWRSHARLRQLVLTWRNARFDGDSKIFSALERWMHRSRRLYQWEASARQGALLARREAYRLAAASFAGAYGTIVFEHIPLKKFVVRKNPEDGADIPLVHRRQLRVGSPAAAREAIVEAAQSAGAHIVQVPTGESSSYCHKCGGLCHWDRAASLWHTCEHCQASWDQDMNGSMNVLHEFLRGSTGDSQVITRSRSMSPTRFGREKSAPTRTGEGRNEES